MALDAGNLRVKLQYAKDIKDCDFFGKQDPYVRWGNFLQTQLTKGEGVSGRDTLLAD
jgi:hypothetical protein